MTTLPEDAPPSVAAARIERLRRRSRQRVHEEATALSARVIHAADLVLRTVYRIPQSLTAQNITEAQRAEDGQTLYRLRTTADHSHYLLCRRCGNAVGFTPTVFELDVGQLAERDHYIDVTHHIDLYGTCSQCAGT